MESKIECERKFLLNNIPNIAFDDIYIINQFYVDDVRFRREEHSECINYIMCTKKNLVKNNPCINEETEVEINKRIYNSVLNAMNVKPITKVRYVCRYNNLTFEIDEFKDLNIILCEVELEDFNSQIVFPEEIKNTIVKEVTNDNSYKNYSIFKKINEYSNDLDFSNIMITLGTDINRKFAWCIQEINNKEMVCIHTRDNGMSTFDKNSFITAIPIKNILKYSRNETEF